MEYLIDIPGRLHSVAVEKHIAGADQIYDDFLKTTLDILNLENITDVKVQEGKLLFLNIQGLVLKEISIASEQKQSDWNLTDSTQIDFIKNKPIIYNKLEVDDKLITKQDIIDDIATIRSNAQAGATAYHKPLTGIPATDLASAVQTSLSKADTALQEHQSLAGLVNTGNYNTVSKKIELKHDNTVLAEIDATTFIKDGMVSSVTISNGYLIITFNTDAGKEPISIALTDIFNPANYYDKIVVDNLLANKVDKENGKGLSTNDYTTDDKNKLNALPTNNALTTILNGKVNTDDLNEYVPKTDDDDHGNMSIYSPGNLVMTLTNELGSVNQTGTFYAGGWSVSSPDGKFQTFGNSIYRGTMGFDHDSVVWEKTATQQIPVATAEKNGLMSAADKKKLDDMKGVSTAADVSYDNTRTGLSAINVQDAIDEMADTNLYETVVLTVGSADSSFNPVGQTITVTLEDGSATQYTVPMSRQITFIVQRGMRYTISGTSTADYRVLPISVKAAIPTRYLTMRYIPIATGVFILQKDGNYYLREEYDAESMAEDAVGVLVLTSALINAGFGIVLHKGETVSTTKNSCNTSVNGWNNTNMLNSLLQSQRCANAAPNNYPSCVKALTRSIEVAGNMLSGCIPTYAVGKMLYANEANINMAMTVIGGSVLSMNNLITCTGSRPNANYHLYYWSGDAREGSKNDRTLTVYEYPLS